MVIISDIQLPKNAEGILKVSDVSTSANSDLSCRTNISNPSTSTFVKTDADGRLNILESNIEGAGADNSLNATEYPVHQVGAFDGSAYRSVKCNSKGFLTNIMNGNTNVDGVSGDTHAIHVDANGNIRVSTVSTVNTAPANNANTSLEVSPSNSFAVGLTARQDIGVASQTPLQCTSQGRLIVDVVELAQSGRITGSTSLSSVQMCGFNTSDSRFKTLQCDVDGKLRNVNDNLYQQVFTNQGIPTGQGEILPANGVEMNNGSGSNVEVYINYGGASGATAADFTFQVHESWDNIDYYLNSSAVFGQVLQNVDAITPKAVKTGMFQFDGRFLKVKVVNNSGNPQDINAYVYVKK